MNATKLSSTFTEDEIKYLAMVLGNFPVQILKDEVAIFDTFTIGNDQVLYLLHYWADTPKSKWSELIKGVVVECKCGIFTIRAWSYPYTHVIVGEPDVSITNFQRELPFTDEIEKIYPEIDWKEAKATYSYEGATLRVYAVEVGGVKRVMVSTHKRIDAYDSKWGDSTFGEMFDEAWLGGVSTPDTPNTHILRSMQNLVDWIEYGQTVVFTVSHPKFSLIRYTSKPILMCSGIFLTDESDFFPPRWVPYTENFKSDSDTINLGLHDWEEYEHTIDSSNEITGLFIFDGKRSFKVITLKVKHQQLIRGSDPNIAIRAVNLVINYQDHTSYKYLLDYFLSDDFGETSIKLHQTQKNLVEGIHLLEKVIKGHFVNRTKYNRSGTIPKFYHIAVSHFIRQGKKELSREDIFDYLKTVKPRYILQELEKIS